MGYNDRDGRPMIDISKLPRDRELVKVPVRPEVDISRKVPVGTDDDAINNSWHRKRPATPKDDVYAPDTVISPEQIEARYNGIGGHDNGFSDFSIS